MGTEDKPFPGAEPAKLNTFRKYYAAHMGTPYDYRLENYRAGSQDLAEMEKRFGPMYGEWAFDGDISKMPMSHFPYTKLGYTPSFWEDPYRVARYYNAVKAQPPGTKPPDWIDTKALEAAYKYFQQVNGNKPFYDWKYLNVNDPARQFFQSLPMPPDESLLPDEVYYKPTPQAQRQPTPVEQLADPRQNPNWDKLPWWNKALSSIFYSGSPLTKALGSGTMMGILGGIGGGLVGLAGGPAGAVAGAALGFKSGFALGGGFSLLETGLGEAAKMTQEQGWEEASKTVSLFHKGTKFIMDALNLAWEGVVKRPVGMGLMAYGHITEPERYGPINDLFADLPNAWRAASFTAISAPVEIMNLPQGIEDLINGRSSDMPYAQPGWEQITPIPQTIQRLMGKEPHDPITGATVWQLGQPEPQPLMDVQGVHPEDVLTGAGWIDALMWSRRQIAEGAPSELVLATMMQRYGISGQMRELFGAVVLDPGIHVFPKAATRGLGILGDITGNQALTKAADYVLSMGREGFAGKGKGPITTLRMYETVLKAETPVEVISAGGRFTRWLGGVERTGEIQRAPQIDEATRILGLSDEQVGQVGKLAEDLNIKVDETNPARGLIERWWEGPEQRAKIRDAMPEVASKLDEIYPKGIKEGTRWAEGRVTGLEQQNGLLARIFGLTPRSKAVEVLGITADTMKILMDQYEDPADIVAAIGRIASMTGLNAEDLSVRFIGTPEGAYLVHALKDFDYKQVQELLKLWNDPGIATKRDVLNLIAKVRNERPYDVLRQLENADQRAPFFKSLMDDVSLRAQQGDAVAAQVLKAAKSGIFTEESLAEMFDLFMTKNIPWHPEQWKAMLFDAWMSHVAKWTIDRLGVRVEPLVTRLADVMKAAQSLLLLDINPNYFVNNCVNNIATMVIDGSFRMKSIASAMDWFEQFGVYPYKLRQAFGGPSELGDAHVRQEKLAAEEMGFIDLAFKSEGEAARAISDAAKGKGGMRVAEDWLKNIRGKVGVFSKLSRKMEEWSSVQATTKGTQQFWDSQWRAGKGYQRMPPALEQQLGSDLSKMIYGLVDGSLNMRQIEDGLVEGQQLYRSIEYFTDDVAKALGMEPEKVTAAMNESGATEFLRQNLPNAKTPGEVRGVFALLRAHVQRHLDDLIVTENVARVETTAAQVKAGDWIGFVDALKDLDRQFDDWWTQHIFKWNDAMGQASKIEDTGVRNKLIAARMAEADMEGRRITGMQVATIDGIQKGMTDAGVGFPENYSNIFRGQLDGWREFFTGRDLAWRDFWAQVQSGELKFGSKDFKDEYVRISTKMDNAYGRQALETSHFQEEMDDAIVRMIADSDEGLADKVGVYFAELRDHKMLQMAREQNIRRVMTQIRIKGTPTGKQVASILRSVFKGDDEWLKAIEPWLKELGEQKVVDTHEINNRLYKEYTENLKIPSISERENIRIDNERAIVEPVVKVPAEKVEVDEGRVGEIVEAGIPKEEATEIATGEGALVDKGPEIKAIPEQEAIARTQALEGVNLDAVRQAASEAGINTATADGRPMDNWLVNWINGDNGLGLRKSNVAIRRLEELDPKELPRVVDKLNTMRDHNTELTTIAQERGMTLDALKYLEDGRASTAKLRKIAVQNGMPDLLASVAPKSIMNDWLTAKREGMPYRGPGDRLMTLGDAKNLFREMTKGSIEGEQQLNDILTIWEQLAKSQGMTLEEYIMRRLASDDPGIAQALYQAQGVNHPWVQNCIREFGITHDPREGFWLLRDGRMLDGSGRNQGMNVTGRRMVSHEDVFMAEPEGPEAGYGDTTAKFMQQTGNVRMSVMDNDVLLQMGGSPSAEQLSTIMRFVAGKRLLTVEYLGLRNGQISDYFDTAVADPRSIEDVSAALAKGDEYYPKSLYQIANPEKGMSHIWVQKALDLFGKTDDPQRGGYIIPDGSMLNFGKEGGVRRYYDHRDIIKVVAESGEYRPGYTDLRRNVTMDFMFETGSARMFMAQGNDRLMLEIYKPMTYEQMIAVNKIAMDNKSRVYVELFDKKSGKLIYYQEATPDARALSEMWGDIDAMTSRTLYQRATAPIFYSLLSRVVDQKMQGKMPAQDALNWVQKQGVKADELQWTGLRDFLEARAAKGGTVTKEEVQWWLDNNKVDLTPQVQPSKEWIQRVQEIDPASVREVVESEHPNFKTWYFITNDAEAEATSRVMNGGYFEGEGPARIELYQGNYVAITRNGEYNLGAFDTLEMAKEALYRGAAIRRGETQYSQYKLPGGADYQEHLLTLPKMSTYEHRAQEAADWLLRQAGASEEDAYLVSRGWATHEDVEVMEKYRVSQEEVAALVKTRWGNFDSPHWNDLNVLAHTRTTSRLDENGNKVFYSEEVQSDWHQKGREVGYLGQGGTFEAMQEATDKLNLHRQRLSDLDIVVARYGRQGIRTIPFCPVDENGNRIIPYKLVEQPTNPPNMRWFMLGTDGDLLATFPSKENAQRLVDILHGISRQEIEGRATVYDGDRLIDPVTGEELGGGGSLRNEGWQATNLQEWSDEMISAFKDYDLAAREYILTESAFKSGIPDAPWKKDWHEVTMRYMLRQAAEQGQDKLAWSTAQTQIERWNLGNYVDQIEWIKTDTVGEEFFINVIAWKEGEQVFAKPFLTSEDAAGYLGVDIAKKMFESSEGRGVFEGEDLYVGKQGMQMFYDELLPRYMAKYGKQWGVEPYLGKIQTKMDESARSEYMIVDLREEERTGQTRWFANTEEKAHELVDYLAHQHPGGRFDIRSNPDFGKANYEDAWMIDITPEMKQSVLYDGQRLFQMPFDDGLARQRSSALESLRQMGLDQPRIDEILTKRNLEGLDPQARAIALEAIAVTDQIRLLDRTGQRYTFGDHVSWLRKQYGGDFTVRVERSEAAMPTLGEGTQQVWKVVDEKTGITLATFTDETIAGMAAKVINDGGYVQPGPQAPKGSVTFLEDTRAVMRALENPDVSTAIHETGHILLKQLDRPDSDIALDWYRTEYKGEVDRLDDGMFIGKDAEDFQEKFSRAFERYLTEGITPIEALKAVFERMKRWLLDIYHAIAGSEIDVKMTDEMRDLFARQLSGDPELRQQIGEYYGARPKAAPVEEPAAPMDVSIGGQLHTQPLTLERWLWDRKRAVDTASKVEDPTQRIEAIQQALNQSDSVKEEGWMPSDALAQDALARAKAELRAVEGIPGLTGNGTSAHGADPTKYYDFVYRVVELDDLIPSHKLNGEDNPDYPSAFQPRQRDRVASRQQIIRIASELDPNSLIYQSQRIDDGAPIIGKDLLVESGNGRVLGLQLATDQYPQNYQAYKNKLLQDATIYGLDPEALQQMVKPILVRQRISDVDREVFVRDANVSATAAMSFTENAASDARLIADDVLGALYVGETQSIEQVLRSPSNRNFVQSFINKLPENEHGLMLDAGGEISRIGIQRIIAALFAKTFGGPAGEKLTRLAFESIDVDVKRVISGIEGALPELARAEALIAAGRRPESLSIGDDIAAAATKLQHLRNQGMKVEDYLGQTQMFGDDLTGFQKRLLMDFGMAQSAKAIREPLLYYGRQIQAQPDTSQTGMFGSYQYPDKAQLWSLARQQGQQQLFQMPPETKMGAMNAVPEPLYMGSLQQEAWDNVQPVLNEMERRMSAGDGWTKTFKRADLDAALGEQRPDFIRWINDIRPDMASTKHTAIRWGENVRDWALLNYQARRGFDGPMSMLMPYFFWPSRTFLRWALRTVDRPGLLANYSRFNQVASMYRTEQFPSRLRGKWRVSLPFLPEWMSGGMWVDPLRQWFPPAMFAENIMRVATEKDRMAKSAAYILEKWVSEGRVSANDAKQATLTMEGDLWGEAVEAAQADEQGEYSGPLDYLGVLSSLAIPFDIARQYARGTPESIQPLPLTRLLKGVTAPFGIGGPGGVNIEAPLRKAVDLPVFDRFEEYRVERMVANMVAEGEIDPKDAEQIFLSHQGPGWDEAEKRVNQARFFGTYANPLYWMGMPADSFPKGEAKLRGLTAEWNRAIDSYHKGDSGALRRMMEEYPEYQFRMDLWKNPQERLRWFLVDEIWTKYNELGSANKELVRMQLGEEFQRTFLDKPPEGESRDYEAIQIELLAFWSQALGAQLPPLPERNNGYEMPKLEPVAPEQQVSLLPPEIANEIDTFRAERNSQYPNWFAIQQRYFDEPQGDARKAYLAANPELKRYWDWKSQYYKDHPMVDAYYKRYSLSDEEGQELANWSVAEILSNPVLMRQITAQQLIGEPLSSGALEELKRIWESMGRPGNSFDQFISEVVSSSNQ